MIMIVKTPGSQMGSPAAAEEGAEGRGGGRGEGGERRTPTSTSLSASEVSASEVDVGVDSAGSEIIVERRRDPE